MRKPLSGLMALLLAVGALATAPMADAEAAPAITELRANDFAYGTYIIDEPGTYRLAEDVSFNPNSAATLTSAIDNGIIPPELASALELPYPVDAAHAGSPLFTQLAPGGVADFTPGGPLDARYDPAAYGVGFFAAIVITADDVVLDLAGHTIEQSAEHALLQRFFAVIELADQPFIPGQGPASFGTDLEAAERVTIKNGTIGRSSHHGIHGNANADVVIRNVAFNDYEVAAVALNGVDGLTVQNVTARNRKDVPVLGTFSAARFIGDYVDHLVRSESGTTLDVDGTTMTASDIQAALDQSVNDVHHDIVANPNMVGGRAQIDPATHPDEYALFHNEHGVVDGNSYSFLVNTLGVAVNGFPTVPDGVTRIPSRDIVFQNVKVLDQRAFINEIPALVAGTTATIDPVGAVFQTRNLHPDTDQPITISDLDLDEARYTGNVLANAQALVAKAAANGEFDGGHLDITRMNLSDEVLAWVEGQSGSETLSQIDAAYYCNGDSMFHVNKGVIGYKMDGATNVRMSNTSVVGIHNAGDPGTDLCGDYMQGFSHPLANLYGYGGAYTRGYTFAGSRNVIVANSMARDVVSLNGPAIGFDVMMDSTNIRFSNSTARGVTAGHVGGQTGSPTEAPMAIGFRVSADATRVVIVRGCAMAMNGIAGNHFLYDDSPGATTVASCNAVR